MTFPWTKLTGTPLQRAAEATYGSDPRRLYHVWPHAGRLYHWAATWDLPYDLKLDRIILGHDVIYDEHPHKEHRSALWLEAMLGVPCADEKAGIMATCDHTITPGGDNRIQLLDLADLGVPELVAPNRALIAQESINLYGITAREFSKANLAYFEAMLPRFPDSLIQALTPEERQRLTAIRAGIQQTIALGRAELR